MPGEPIYPGVYIEEAGKGARAITGVPTSIALIVGWCARGPTKRAMRVRNFADFQRTYGGLDARTFLGYAVNHYFDNGGTDAYIVRLAGADAETASVTIGQLTVTADSPGAWANDYRIRTTQRPAPDNSRFKIEVLDGNNFNAVVENFEDLSMDRADARFVEKAVSGHSSLITVSASGTSTPADGTVDLGSGTAGTVGTVLVPGTADFHTALLAQFGTGTVTEGIDLFNLVCVPGETDSATLAVLQGHCHRRRAFLIIDADPTATVASLRAGAPAALTSSNAPNSAIFFPWVRARRPSQAGALVDFPPCGFVAGVFARTDGTRGVWKAPSGGEASLIGASGLALTLSNAENDLLNPLGINCLRTLPNRGTVVWGSRTLDGQSDRPSTWKYIPVRRMALFLEESLYRGTQWVVFEPNDGSLWAEIRLKVEAFLHGIYRQGAFQGRKPSEAYFVKCDRETTTQADIDLGIVNILVGFAPLKPAEFVCIKIQQMAGGKA